jgi:hypothetical protein
VILCDIAHGIGKIVALENGAINVVDHLRMLRENAKSKPAAHADDKSIGSRAAANARLRTGTKPADSAAAPLLKAA